VFLEDLGLVNLFWESNKQELATSNSRVDDALKDLNYRIGIMEAVVTLLHAHSDSATTLCLSFNFLIDNRPHVKDVESLLNKALCDVRLCGKSGFTTTCAYVNYGWLDYVLNFLEALFENLLSVDFANPGLIVKELLEVDEAFVVFGNRLAQEGRWHVVKMVLWRLDHALLGGVLRAVKQEDALRAH
jgi:hypothetical protein